MQNLENTQLKQTINQGKEVDTQGSNDHILEDIQPIHKWLFSLNTIWNTILLVFCVQGCNQIIDWIKNDTPATLEEEIQKEVLRALELEEIQREVSRTLKLEKKEKRTLN